MIGNNIKRIRKKNNLTQAEFSEKIGVSRNTLSRYENSTTPVTLATLSTISKEFNVPYEELIGEGTKLSAVEEFNLTLKIEILKERGAEVLAMLYDFQFKEEINISEKNNPWIIISDDLEEVINTKIYEINDFESVERYLGYLDGIERMILMAKLQRTA